MVSSGRDWEDHSMQNLEQQSLKADAEAASGGAELHQRVMSLRHFASAFSCWIATVRSRWTKWQSMLSDLRDVAQIMWDNTLEAFQTV